MTTKYWKLKFLKWLADQTHYINGKAICAYHAESNRLFREAVGEEWLNKTTEELYPHTDWRKYEKK